MPIHQLMLIDEKSMNDKKTCCKNSKRMFKTFFHIMFLEIDGRFTFFKGSYQQRKDLVSESHQKNLKKNGRMEYMNWTEGASFVAAGTLQ